MSELDEEPKNFHLSDFIARHHQQQPPFHHNPSASATTMLYNNYYHHPETPLPPLPSFFHPSATTAITPSTKAFHSIRDVVLHHQHHPPPPPQHQHHAKIRVRNFPKEVVDVAEEEKTASSHFSLHYHERDRLIREHQHEQQIKRSRPDAEQQERIPSQPSLMEGCSKVVVNGGNNELNETKNYHHGSKVADDNDETSNLMYTNRNSSGQHNRFLMGVKGEFFVFIII